VDLADLNDDAAPDLLSCHLDGLAVYLNGGPSTLAEAVATWSGIKALFR
jgi:hypothetical protein